MAHDACMPPNSKNPSILSAILCLVAAIGASVPAWIVKYPPLQDMPYHAATIRVIHSFGDPSFALSQHFQLRLGNTHYLLYYVIGSLLAYIVGVMAANAILLGTYFTGTVWAMRSLLRSMGRDTRLCLFVIPLLSNVLLIYGLLPFLFGLPFLFWGLSVAMRHFREPSLRSGLLLAGISVSCFFAHIVPFGLLCIGILAMFPYERPLRWLRSVLPVAPSLGLLLWWTFLTDAGTTTQGVLSKENGGRSIESAIGDLQNWLTNIFRDGTDEAWFVAFIVLVVLCAAMALGDTERIGVGARRYALVPIACIIAYFTMPVQHDFIWPLGQRFAILMLITAVPIIPFPSGRKGHAATICALIIAGGVTYNTSKHFVSFQNEEVADFEAAVNVIERGSKVCGLIWDKGSKITRHQPFLHYASWVQAKKGGVVMFTFAGYPHWPFAFRPDNLPPQGARPRARWEWEPERVRMDEIYPYYDYVLERGRRLKPSPDEYQRVFNGNNWSLWKRQPTR